MKQTAVEFLIDWMSKTQYFIGNDLLKAVEQAKEKHKGELMRAFLINDDSISIQDALEKFENYYNQTFKSE